MQKLKQTPLQLQQQQTSASIQHAYVIPIPVVPSESMQNISAQQNINYSSETSDTSDSTNNPVIINSSQCQFTPIIPDATNVTSSASGALVAPTPISGSIGSGGYVQYHEGPSLANFQTFSCTSHAGFFLPAGYRLIYAPTGTPQSQPATPATPQIGSSHDGTPPTEPQHCSENVTILPQADQ